MFDKNKLINGQEGSIWCRKNSVENTSQIEFDSWDTKQTAEMMNYAAAAQNGLWHHLMCPFYEGRRPFTTLVVGNTLFKVSIVGH